MLGFSGTGLLGKSVAKQRGAGPRSSGGLQESIMAQPSKTPMRRIGSYEGRKERRPREVWSWSILYVAPRCLGFFLKGIRTPRLWFSPS